VNVLGWIEDLAPELEAIGADRPPQPRWDQDWFPRLDAAAAYAIVRKTQPRRIVEVGSGHSTRFLARAVADGKLETEITAIDPQPRAGTKRKAAPPSVTWAASAAQARSGSSATAASRPTPSQRSGNGRRPNDGHDRPWRRTPRK